MKRVLTAALSLCLLSPLALAQSHTYPEWAARAFGKSSGGGGSGIPPGGGSWWADEDDRQREREEKQRPWGEPVRDGGPRPHISPQAPPLVAFPYSYPANSIVIDTSSRKLYYVLPGSRAYAYSIGVGREGFGWSGVEKVSRKQEWPDWHPPKEMRERDPSLPEKMTGGVRNPLGAVAMYLGNTLYRIHGTNDARSIGRAQSSGCFRMMNSAALHLAQITQVGTTVAVVTSLERGPRVSQAPAPQRSPSAVVVNAADRDTPRPAAAPAAAAVPPAADAAGASAPQAR